MFLTPGPELGAQITRTRYFDMVDAACDPWTLKLSSVSVKLPKPVRAAKDLRIGSTTGGTRTLNSRLAMVISACSSSCNSLVLNISQMFLQHTMVLNPFIL